VSLQPNAGSQGELAGLLAIRGYHRANGDDQRDVCLIPSSRARHQRRQSRSWPACASSSSPATRTATSTSTTCAPRSTEHGDRLAALMVTYPSTHGVFEDDDRRDLRDGPRRRRPGLRRRRQPQRARRVGRPGRFGADVST
jgi:glycine dehydrogenase